MFAVLWRKRHRAVVMNQAHGLVGHGDAPVLSEGCEPLISGQDVPLRYRVGCVASRSKLPRERFSPMVESRCGAVALGRTYLLPPLSSGGALVVPPWLRFHIPLIEPDRQISRIRLVWGFVCQGGINPFLSSFVIPFFCSTCAASILSSRPHICIAVAHSGGQGRRFFSAAEGLSLTDASTAAGC